MKKQKILITGSGGFIFSNFVRLVLKSKTDYNIVGTDNCSNNKVLNTVYANKGHSFHIVDATSPLIDKIFDLERPDLVIHGAFKNNNINDNISSTLNVIQLCENYNCKLLYTSSYEVYGESINATEDDPLDPKDKDNVARMISEILISKSSLDYNILRLSDNIGPRIYSGFIRQIIKNVIDNEQVTLSNNGLQIRDWIHVQDTCAAIITLIEDWSSRQVYNISSKQEFSLAEVYKTITNSLEISHNLVYSISIDEPNRFGADNSKLLEKGWEPTWRFKDSIKHCCHWFKNNQWFLKG